MVRLVERTLSEGEVWWDPDAGQIDAASLEGFDGVSISRSVSELVRYRRIRRRPFVDIRAVPCTYRRSGDRLPEWRSGIAGRNRALRVVAGLLIGYGVVCLTGPFTPMHLRGVEPTLTDTMHIIGAMVDVLFILLTIGFGANAFGKRFRLYSIGTIVVLLDIRSFGRYGRSQGCGKPANALGRGDGAHQHRRLPSMASGAGHHSLT